MLERALTHRAVPAVSCPLWIPLEIATSVSTSHACLTFIFRRQSLASSDHTTTPNSNPYRANSLSQSKTSKHDSHISMIPGRQPHPFCCRHTLTATSWIGLYTRTTSSLRKPIRSNWQWSNVRAKTSILTLPTLAMGKNPSTTTKASLILPSVVS